MTSYYFLFSEVYEQPSDDSGGGRVLLLFFFTCSIVSSLALPSHN